MVMRELLPLRDEILAMKEPPNVKTHDEVIDHLFKAYGIKVSSPTITRFLHMHAPHLVNTRKLSPADERAVAPLEAFLRVEAEVIAMREELGVQIDTLTEQTVARLAVLTAEIAELEKAILDKDMETLAVPDNQSLSPKLMVLLGLLLCALGVGVIWLLLFRP